MTFLDVKSLNTFNNGSIRAVFTNRGLSKVVALNPLDDRTPNKEDVVKVSNSLSGVKIQRNEPSKFPTISSLAGMDYVGYVIEKERLDRTNNKWIRTDEYKIIGSATSVLKDTRIAYGEFYRYRIKSIAKVTLPVVIESESDPEVLTMIEAYQNSRISKEIESKSSIINSLGNIVTVGLSSKTSDGVKPMSIKLSDTISVQADASKISIQKLPEVVSLGLATGKISDIALKKFSNQKAEELSKTKKIEYYSIYYESEPSKDWIYVEAVENVVPPPPNSFHIVPSTPSNIISIFWVKPSNDQRDVQKICIYRRNKVGEQWRRLAVVPASFNMYVDRSVLVGQKYIYALTAIDAHGLESFLSTQILAELNPQYTFEKSEKLLKWVSGSGAKITEVNSIFKKFLERNEQIIAKKNFTIGINSKFAGDDKDLIIRVTSLDTHVQHEIKVKLKNVNIHPTE